MHAEKKFTFSFEIVLSCFALELGERFGQSMILMNTQIVGAFDRLLTTMHCVVLTTIHRTVH